MDETYDVIIVGAGSAGCVVAAKLSEDPTMRVLLLEAGPPDTSLYVHVPKGFGELVQGSTHTWLIETEAQGDIPSEIWRRGRTLGGSSAVNGMMYFRGQPQDYDEWEARGGRGWGWSQMRRVFEAMEDHELGAAAGRGVGGPLRLTAHAGRNPASLAFVQAGREMGLPVRHGIGEPELEGVGLVTRTIAEGRRVSSATAFLTPSVRRRRNLRIVTGALVSRVLFENRCAVGVAAQAGGQAREFRARRDVVLSAGALMSPKILQLSGVGPGDHLRDLGIKVVADTPGVGGHLLEHRLLTMKYRLNRRVSQNPQYRGWRLARNALQYVLTRSGVLAAGSHEAAAFVKTRPELDRPDVEILMAPYSLGLVGRKFDFETEPGLHVFGYPLRSRSEGSIRLRSPDPSAPAFVRADYLSDPYDQQVSIDMFRYIRRLMARPAVAGLIEAELSPGPELQADEDIVRAYRTRGQPGYHACGTCKMGDDRLAVVDERLRVRGVDNLRVVDGSIMPTMISSNPNGPIMAIGWRGAELMRAANQA